jgi:23S rRNA (guanosine2251-2'-O)-methyltransferase
VFRCPVIKCAALDDALQDLRKQKTNILALCSNGDESIFSHRSPEQSVYLLGNESEGLSQNVRQAADKTIYIPMEKGVESLNVAVSAALVSFIAGTAD